MRLKIPFMTGRFGSKAASPYLGNSIIWVAGSGVYRTLAIHRKRPGVSGTDLDYLPQPDLFQFYVIEQGIRTSVVVF